MLIQVETGGAGVFTSASLAVTVLGWAAKHVIHLERESFCDALRATTIPGTSRSTIMGADSTKLPNWSVCMREKACRCRARSHSGEIAHLACAPRLR